MAKLSASTPKIATKHCNNNLGEFVREFVGQYFHNVFSDFEKWAEKLAQQFTQVLAQSAAHTLARHCCEKQRANMATKFAEQSVGEKTENDGYDKDWRPYWLWGCTDATPPETGL